MVDGYHHFEDETQINNGPALNASSVPKIEVRRSWKPRWCNDSFKVLVAGAIVFSLAIAIALVTDILLRSSHKKFVEVITDNAKCTEIVNNLLKNTKANAVDAAICGMICLAVVMPDQTSFASGGYMLVHTGESTKTIDFQFSASNVYNETKDQQKSLAVAVPRMVEGMKFAHKKHGNIPWRQVIAPTLNFANQGFVVNDNLAKHVADHYLDFTGKMKRTFSKDSSHPVKAGDVLKIEGLHDALSHLLNDETNKLEEDILKTVNGFDLNWTKATLNGDVITEESALSASFDDIEISSTSAPSSGAALISAVNILRKLEPHSTNVSESYRELAEVLGIMFDNRKQFGNIQEILSDDYATKTAKEIREKSKSASSSNNAGSDTKVIGKDENVCTGAKVIVIDHDGESVSIVSSLGHVFGSKVMTDMGIVLNDGIQMFEETGKNAASSLRRPSSFAAPVIAFNKKKSNQRDTFAASTDREGLGALLQVLDNHFLDGMSIEDAINKARIIYDKSSNELTFEGQKAQSASIESSLSYLQKFYYKINKSPRDMGHVFCATETENGGKIVQRRSVVEGK